MKSSKGASKSSAMLKNVVFAAAVTGLLWLFQWQRHQLGNGFAVANKYNFFAGADLLDKMGELAVGIFDSHVGQGQSPLMLLYRALTMLVVAGYNASMLSVAIDGPAGAGKSTVARQVASALGCTYVDTGAMYRAVAWAVIHRGLAPEDSEAVCGLAARLEIGLDRGCVYADEQDITGEIRTPEISDLTSRLSALPCVRERLADLQREMGRRGGVVMEGRDIGTVVLPNAEVKVFLTASLAERVRRRREELGAAGIALSSEQLEKDIVERDARDASRDAAPMVPASDAVPLVSDGLSVEEVVSRILVLCLQVGAKHE